MSKELPQEFHYLVLFGALSGRAFTKSELDIKMIVAQLDRLAEETGLLDVKRKGRSSARIFSSNDATLHWAGANLNVELKGKNKAVLLILDLVRAKTAAFLKANQISIQDFLRPAVSLSGSSAVASDPAPIPIADGSSPVEAVRRAYLEISGGTYKARVLLKHLRKRLPFDRQIQDDAFLGLIPSGEADFYPEDDPMSRDEEDERAALVLADRRRHVVYLNREPRT